MRTRFQLLPALLLLTLTLTHCSSNQGGVGTTVGNPTGTVPASLLPGFDTAIPEESLGSELSDSSTLTKATTVSAPTHDAALVVEDRWERIFLDGGVQDARRHRVSLEDFFSSVSAAFTSAGTTEAGDTVASVSVTSEFLTTTETSWTVELSLDDEDDFLRMNIKKASTGDVWATYVFHTTSGVVDKGLFVYVNPELISATPSGPTRMMGLAFDFTDSTQNLMTMRFDDSFPSNTDVNYTFHLHYQCNSSTQACLGEYIDLVSEATTTAAFNTPLRYSWLDSSKDVCLAEIDYSSGIGVGTTEGFVGPEVPDSDDVTTGCTIDTPHWGSHVYTIADLPTRYIDTDPDGGLAQSYFDSLNGTSLETTFPATLIDTWLDASSF